MKLRCPPPAGPISALPISQPVITPANCSAPVSLALISPNSSALSFTRTHFTRCYCTSSCLTFSSAFPVSIILCEHCRQDQIFSVFALVAMLVAATGPLPAKEKFVFQSLVPTLDPLPPPKVLHGSVIESSQVAPPPTNAFWLCRAKKWLSDYSQLCCTKFGGMAGRIARWRPDCKWVDWAGQGHPDCAKRRQKIWLCPCVQRSPAALIRAMAKKLPPGHRRARYPDSGRLCHFHGRGQFGVDGHKGLPGWYQPLAVVQGPYQRAIR